MARCVPCAASSPSPRLLRDGPCGKKKRPESLQDVSTFLYDTLTTFSRPSIGTNFKSRLVRRIGSCLDFGFFKRISFDWSRTQGFSGFWFFFGFSGFLDVGFSRTWIWFFVGFSFSSVFLRTIGFFWTAYQSYLTIQTYNPKVFTAREETLYLKDAVFTATFVNLRYTLLVCRLNIWDSA